MDGPSYEHKLYTLRKLHKLNRYCGVGEDGGGGVAKEVSDKPGRFCDEGQGAGGVGGEDGGVGRRIRNSPANSLLQQRTSLRTGLHGGKCVLDTCNAFCRLTLVAGSDVEGNQLALFLLRQLGFQTWCK
jgi:hypothetical protein